MTFIRRNIIQCLLINVVMLCACTSTSCARPTAAPTSLDGSCIPPVATLAYPVGIPPSSPNEKNSEIAPMEAGNESLSCLN